jgi:ABC-type antimicrobial peptide transport system permease subunit
MALGASPSDILRLVVANGSRLAAAGVALGIGLSLFATRAMSGLLFGVTARDPWTLAGVAVAVAAATLAACYVPARRALRVDPMAALRSE